MRKKADIREIQKAAEQHCLANGLKLTQGREDVLRLVVESDHPVKAYDLITKLSKGDKKPMPPLIYRALDFWAAHGFIHRIDSLNAYTCCTHPGCTHDCQLFICSHCEKVFELCEKSVPAELLKAAETKGFEVEHITIELSGRCPDCR